MQRLAQPRVRLEEDAGRDLEAVAAGAQRDARTRERAAASAASGVQRGAAVAVRELELAVAGGGSCASACSAASSSGTSTGQRVDRLERVRLPAPVADAAALA